MEFNFRVCFHSCLEGNKTWKRIYAHFTHCHDIRVSRMQRTIGQLKLMEEVGDGNICRCQGRRCTEIIVVTKEPIEVGKG